MDIIGYKFKEQDKAKAAYEKIIVSIGPIAELEDKEVTITAPEESANDAAKICESLGGRRTTSFLF